MIELSLAIAISIATFGFGGIGGILLYYFAEGKPRADAYNKLVHTLTHMKRQGFVPHYDLEQATSIDLSEGVDES